MRNWILAVLGIVIIGVVGCASQSNPEAERNAIDSAQSNPEAERNVIDSAQSTPEAERNAIDSAQAWLELVDNQKYMESWEETAEFFKSGVPKQNWQEMMSILRKPLGKTLSRELIFQEDTTSIPGAPDGEYVVIHYKTSFEHNERARETIRSRLDSDNSWRVVGYYIN